MSGPIYHGPSHSPIGADPASVEEPHLVGEAGEPPFLNSCANMLPTVAIPDPTPLQFYMTAGAPNIVDGTTILEYIYHELVIVGDVLVPSDAWGEAIFNLPARYRYPSDRPYHGHDDLGGYVAGRLFANGDFVSHTP